ncbi:MAG: GntR family transcriptional regulator [Planctomycetaceae bacterium]|nr:GntR family transcriptional regulator [Planctomycetaceae bacterium]
MDRTSRSGNLAKQVEDEIRTRIVNGQIPLGSQISEQALADTLGVSKTPVRNALLRLQDEDLVEIKPQKRTVVCRPDAEQFQNVSLVRTILEPVALACAYRQSFDLFIAGLKDIYDEMVISIDAADYQAYIAQDMRFHDLFFEYCMNPYLKKSYRLIRSLLAILRFQLTHNEKHLKKSFVEHNAIIGHLENHDCESALEILDSHIAFNNKSYWSNIASIVEEMYSK